MLKTLAVAAFIGVLALAAQADAFGGGGGKRGGSHTVASDASVAGSSSSTGGNGSSGGTVAASEPVTALAVGLGLLGARYLRRRR
jgi:hypothetical protein